MCNVRSFQKLNLQFDCECGHRKFSFIDIGIVIDNDRGNSLIGMKLC